LILKGSMIVLINVLPGRNLTYMSAVWGIRHNKKGVLLFRLQRVRPKGR
jgi:hypothetical protein